MNKIVATANDIPADEHEMVDECVVMPNTSSSQVTSSNTSVEAPIQVVKKEESEEKVSTNCSAHAKSPISSPHNVGDSVVARWSEDDVWYNAVVDSLDEVTGEAHVTFIDYGNTATVSISKIVATANDIPADELEMVDECVQLTSYLPLQSGPLASIKEEEVSSSPSTPEASPPCKAVTRKAWKVGEVCIARWADDGVWYNGKILELGDMGCLVRFSDYGNEDTVREEDMVRKVGDIPADNDIDECVETEAAQPENSPVPSSLQY